jgi:4-amino-4-deoxy-L-arabinose transferase-like glycosyltransferase
VAVEAAVVLVVAAGLVLRFWARSALWLDEALTVNIAAQPLHAIPSYLKRDGAPPLYYVVLHFWMKVSGNSDVALRSLSGLLSVATLPVAWVATRRFGGRTAATVVVLFLATSPFAVYYATEVRMYSLVMFLTACGMVALIRVFDAPRPGNLVALGVVVAALLYTQYWSLYLTGAVGLWLVFEALWSRPGRRRAARWSLVAVAGGCLAFVPWLPTFVYQSRYTGTPWAGTPTYAAIVNAITGFTDNQASLALTGSNQGRLLALGYFVLAGLALFGLARGRWHIDLDVRTRPVARALAFVVVVTLVAAITGGIVSRSAFSPRYASVVFVPLLVMMAAGAALAFADAAVRTGVVGVVVAAGLASSIPNVYTQRTQAPQVAAVLAAHGRPGDVVAFCPDQLGPATVRALPPGRYRTIAFPRAGSGEFVDWVSYLDVAQRTRLRPFEQGLERAARAGHHIWLVSAPGYAGFGGRCDQIVADIAAKPAFGAHQFVAEQPGTYYEPMSLFEFAYLH